MNTATELSESKRRLLEQYLKGNLVHEAGDRSAILPVPRDRHAPLSLAQEQLFLRAQATAGMPPLYNESITVYRDGSLDVSALERSLAEIIRRHEAWRTTFEVVDGHLIQVVHPAPETISLPVIDLRGSPSGLDAITEVVRRPFDLSRAPLYRPFLTRLADEQYRLYLAEHQIIIDGVTAYQVLYPELVSLYNSFSEGRQSSLPELPVQFSDFAHWQRKNLTPKVLDAQLAYWRRQFSGPLPILQWPNDFTRPLSQTFRGQIHSWSYNKPLSDAVAALSQRLNVTLFASLMAAFVTLLYSYTGQEDMIVGTVVPAGRDRSEVQGLMGYFLNPVGIRTQLAGNLSFLDILQQVRKRMLEALANDDVPFEQVAAALHLPPDPSRNPIFQVAASLEPTIPNVGPGWDMTPMDLQNGGSRWDLYFVWDKRDEGIFGRVQYNPDLFAATTVSKMVDDFESLLELVTRNSNTTLSEIFRAIRRS